MSGGIHSPGHGCKTALQGDTVTSFEHAVVEPASHTSYVNDPDPWFFRLSVYEPLFDVVVSRLLFR